MGIDVYAQREGDRKNSIYHTLERVKGIISNPFSSRIIFSNGEIELVASQDELRIYSKQYLSNGETVVTHEIVKDLTPGYDSQKALNKAKKDILQRVVSLEMKLREKEALSQIQNHLELKFEKSKKQKVKIISFKPRKTIDEFLVIERREA
jgi:hypothetical protein